MACPSFMPVSRLDQDMWLHAPRLPLGDPYRGVCHAGSEPFIPPDSSQEELCNCGYARGRCDRLPDDSADAARFSVIAGGVGWVTLVYILEKNHAPAQHGVLQYSTQESRFENPPGGLMEAQARAFVESHLRRASAWMLPHDLREP